MTLRAISNITRSFLISTMLLSVGACGAYAQPASAPLSTSVRLEHARELLGRHYKKTVEKTAQSKTAVRDFIEQITKASLAKKWKRTAPRIARAIIKESKRYGFDPIFLVSVIQTESSFSPTALGTSGEIGLMQLRPETAKWIADEFDLPWRGKKTLYNPVSNIRIGAAYLSLLREKFGKDGRLYIPAYNMGATAVRDAVAQRIFPVDYVRRVMGRYLENYSRISFQLGHEHLTRQVRVRTDHKLREAGADRILAEADEKS